MGQAREIMDRITAAVMSGDREALGQLYAADAVAETPDGPRLQGGAAIADYLLTFKRAFPDASFESLRKYEAGDTAIDEGYFVGTHTGPLMTPSGEVPPTGRRVSVPMAVLNRHDESGTTEVEHRHLDMTTMAQQLGLVWPRGCRTPRARSWRGGPGGADRLVQLLDVAADL